MLYSPFVHSASSSGNAIEVKRDKTGISTRIVLYNYNIQLLFQNLQNVIFFVEKKTINRHSAFKIE